MKKILSKKLFALTLLFAFLVFTFFASSASAQDVELLPNASPKDYQVETAPYKGQEYEVQTASPIDDWTSAILRDLLDNTLGTVFNSVFEKIIPDIGENVGKWSGDFLSFSIIHIYDLLLGPQGLRGSGMCAAKDGALQSDECDEGYTPSYVDDYCECVRDTMVAVSPANYGIVGGMGAMATTVVQQGPPDMHLAQFAKDKLADNIFSTTAYAKTGASYFDPVIVIWRLMRNIAYVLMVLILVGMGFMVMLRSKIDPRTTMTVSAALPRLAMSLILIAFSYPIAGIIVDIGRLLKGLIDATLGPIMTLHTLEPFQLIVDLFGNFIGVSVLDLRHWLGLQGNINLGGTGVIALSIEIGMALIAIVIAFMLFFTLVFRFAGLFMQVIFAPFVFAWGALPGQENTTTKWFKSFAVNVLCFPVIYLIVNLSNFIAVMSLNQPMALPTDLGWGTINPNVQTNVGGLVAFGLLMAATKVPAMLEDAFDVAPSGGAARAGVDIGKTLGRLPVVGKIIK